MCLWKKSFSRDKTKNKNKKYWKGIQLTFLIAAIIKENQRMILSGNSHSVKNI